MEDEFNLTKNALLTTLTTLPYEWMVEFEFKPTDLSNPDWTNIFHMTKGNHNEAIGDRIPAVFFLPRDGLHITTALKNKKNFWLDLPAPTIGMWTKIRISQELLNKVLKFRIFINDIEKLIAENSVAMAFENVKVFASNPWDAVQPGSIKYLSINVKGDCFPTKEDKNEGVSGSKKTEQQEWTFIKSTALVMAGIAMAAASLAAALAAIKKCNTQVNGLQYNFNNDVEIDYPF